MLLYTWTSQTLQRMGATMETVQMLPLAMHLSWLDRVVLVAVLLAALYWTAKR